MLKLGHITYSNCFPVHAGIVTGAFEFPFGIVEGVPTELNRMLYDGTITVSPSSSIEFAMNPGRYLIMPDLSITSRTRALSIILESRLPIQELDGKTIAMTTASASSVVLLRVLLEMQHGVHPDFTLFEQGVEEPSGSVAAMLTIGDLALQKAAMTDYPYVYDLGEEWHAFTGLPFVFALWQIHYKKNIDKDLAVLYDILLKSKSFGLARLRALADAHAVRFGLSAQTLFDYWSSFSFDLGGPEQKGLMQYYGYAAEIGAIETVPELRFWGPAR